MTLKIDPVFDWFPISFVFGEQVKMVLTEAIFWEFQRMSIYIPSIFQIIPTALTTRNNSTLCLEKLFNNNISLSFSIKIRLWIDIFCYSFKLFLHHIQHCFQEFIRIDSTPWHFWFAKLLKFHHLIHNNLPICVHCHLSSQRWTPFQRFSQSPNHQWLHLNIFLHFIHFFQVLPEKGSSNQALNKCI